MPEVTRLLGKLATIGTAAAAPLLFPRETEAATINLTKLRELAKLFPRVGDLFDYLGKIGDRGAQWAIEYVDGRHLPRAQMGSSEKVIDKMEEIQKAIREKPDDIFASARTDQFGTLVVEMRHSDFPAAPLVTARGEIYGGTWDPVVRGVGEGIVGTKELLRQLRKPHVLEKLYDVKVDDINVTGRVTGVAEKGARSYQRQKKISLAPFYRHVLKKGPPVERAVQQAKDTVDQLADYYEDLSEIVSRTLSPENFSPENFILRAREMVDLEPGLQERFNNILERANVGSVEPLFGYTNRLSERRMLVNLGRIFNPSPATRPLERMRGIMREIEDMLPADVIQDQLLSGEPEAAETFVRRAREVVGRNPSLRADFLSNFPGTDIRTAREQIQNFRRALEDPEDLALIDDLEDIFLPGSSELGPRQRFLAERLGDLMTRIRVRMPDQLLERIYAGNREAIGDFVVRAREEVAGPTNPLMQEFLDLFPRFATLGAVTEEIDNLRAGLDPRDADELLQLEEIFLPFLTRSRGEATIPGMALSALAGAAAAAPSIALGVLRVLDAPRQAVLAHLAGLPISTAIEQVASPEKAVTGAQVIESQLPSLAAPTTIPQLAARIATESALEFADPLIAMGALAKLPGILAKRIPLVPGFK